MKDNNTGRRDARDILGMTDEQAEDDRMMIACRLTAFRLAATNGMNQTQFYNNCGLPVSAGSHYERGYALPSREYARVLYRKYAMSLDYLFEGKMSALPGDVAKDVAKRLPMCIADFKDKMEMERRANQRAGLGFVSNQRLQNEKEKKRNSKLYADLKRAREDSEKATKLIADGTLKASKSAAKKR
jgi:hypothetical protein